MIACTCFGCKPDTPDVGSNFLTTQHPQRHPGGEEWKFCPQDAEGTKKSTAKVTRLATFIIVNPSLESMRYRALSSVQKTFVLRMVLSAHCWTMQPRVVGSNNGVVSSPPNH